MIRPALLATLWAGSSLLLSDPAAAQDSRSFFCGEGSYVTITPTGPDTLTAGPIDGQMREFYRNPSARGEFYSGEYGLRAIPSENRIIVEIPDFGDISCIMQNPGNAPQYQPPKQPQYQPPRQQPQYQPPRQQPQYQPPRQQPQYQPPRVPQYQPPQAAAGAARSWGGVFRAGPGVGYPRLGSIAEGTYVTILNRAEAPPFNGYPWFRISYNGRVGYHWGGILCPIDQPIPGTTGVCN